MKIYGIELSFNNKTSRLPIPVNPSAIDVGESGQGKTYNVAGLGEINVIKERRLSEYSFSGIFPARHYPFVTVSELYPPDFYIEMIEFWLNQKRPIRFIMTSDSFDINTPASIESFDWREVAGSGGDIEYNIKLKKYVFYAARKIVQKAPTGSGTAQKASTTKPRPNDKQQPKTYTMVAGDSLWKVAQKQLGNGDRWKEIQTLNGIKDADLKRLAAGKVLKLP
ncbi:LysM domain-containing protein [Paenibacillus pinisoli]|uniref:LysM domain-containing protein n=1 Tax=Paenibacillus pinisoli TaxID=1276110 RepID=A0A3A6PM99_9BACL|nr:LysM domain-containing protein [Paenibacillus pinisoli]RJX40866.1 LysM domain-containing protein [Paenibacillus pinisoli]